MTAGAAPGRAAGPVRTIFFGSGSFAVPILEAVASHPSLEVVAVITAPDKPVGRSRVLTPTPVADRARALGLRVLQPDGVRSPAVIAELAALQPDLGVLADYGRIIPQALLDLPPFGILGVHPSRLPRHRGATPIEATILRGDAEAGASIYRMDAGLDTGPLLATSTWSLVGRETSPELEADAASRSARLLAEALPAYLGGSATLTPQGDTQASVTTRLARDHARLDPSRSAVELERQVRAFTGWPGSFIETTAGRLGVVRAGTASREAGDAVGQIVEATGGRPGIATGDGRLVLERVQPAGGREMDGAAWLRGHRDLLGTSVIGTGTGGAATVSAR